MTDEIEILGCSALGCHNDAAYCPVCYEGAHLRGLLQGDARTLAAAITRLETDRNSYQRYAKQHLQKAEYELAKGYEEWAQLFTRAIESLGHLLPASDALDAAKLAFGGRVELTIRSSICMGCRKGTPRRFDASWAQPSWIHGAKSGDFLCGVQCALDLKALLSTSAVKEER